MLSFKMMDKKFLDLNSSKDLLLLTNLLRQK